MDPVRVTVSEEGQGRAALVAWSLFAITIIISIVDVSVMALGWRAQEPAGAFGPRGLMLIVAVPAAVVGALLASRHPSNPIGWLLCLIGMNLSAFELAALYGIYAVIERQGVLPAAEVSAWLTGWLWGPAIIMLGLVFLLFPDGSLRSRYGRILAIVLLVSWSAAAVATAFLPGPVDTFREIENPFGASWATGLQTFASLPAYLSLIACTGSLIPRYRQAEFEERAQITWIIAAAILIGAAYAIYVIVYLSSSGAGGADQSIVDAAEALIVVSLAGLMVAFGVAILKYRLYDIDVVINKAIVFGALVVSISVVYVGVVIGVGAAVGSFGNAALSAIAAALVALLFQPIRRAAQQLANRLVYGKRATPYEVLHAFSERIAGSYRTEDALDRMATILADGTGAARVQVWLRSGPRLRPAAAWPEGVERSESVPLSGAGMPELPGVSYAIPVRDEQELLGAFSVTTGSADGLSPTERRLMDDLAHQAGLVLRNVRLVDDLRASRARLVAAQDQERRKIERNIHDGVQQQLVALQVRLRLLEKAAEHDPDKVLEIARELQAPARDALDDLRDLARGIYPPLLEDQGLPAALGAQVRKAVVPVELRANDIGRYPQQVEAAIYFCCLEAMNNIAKYADASHASVSLARHGDAVTFTVSDDGRGFETALTDHGTGLQGMSDRLEAIGGELIVESKPGGGTTIVGRVPAHDDPGERLDTDPAGRDPVTL